MSSGAGPPMRALSAAASVVPVTAMLKHVTAIAKIDLNGLTSALW
jgi:hypothetical protein